MNGDAHKSTQDAFFSNFKTDNISRTCLLNTIDKRYTTGELRQESFVNRALLAQGDAIHQVLRAASGRRSNGGKLWLVHVGKGQGGATALTVEQAADLQKFPPLRTPPLLGN